MGAEDATKFTAILAWVQSQEARLAALEGQAPPTGRRSGIRRQYLRELRQAEQQRRENPSAFYALFSPSPVGPVDLKHFRQPRIILRMITLEVRAHVDRRARRHGPGPAPGQLRDRGGVGGGSRELDDARTTARCTRSSTTGSTRSSSSIRASPRRRACASCSSRCRARSGRPRGRRTLHRVSGDLHGGRRPALLPALCPRRLDRLAAYCSRGDRRRSPRRPDSSSPSPKTVLGSWVMLSRGSGSTTASARAGTSGRRCTPASSRASPASSSPSSSPSSRRASTRASPSLARLMAATTLCVALPQTFWLVVCIRDARAQRPCGRHRKPPRPRRVLPTGEICVRCDQRLHAHRPARLLFGARGRQSGVAQRVLRAHAHVHLQRRVPDRPRPRRLRDARAQEPRAHPREQTRADPSEYGGHSEPSRRRGRRTDAASRRAARRTGGSPRNMRVGSGGWVAPAAAPEPAV